MSRGLFIERRGWNIALRAAHLAAMGVLVGGHAFDVVPERLAGALWATLLTGAALTLSESGLHFLWFHQVRGLATLAKLVLLAAVPVFWAHRAWILLAVVVLASVGAHLPARYRYYSVLHRRIIRSSCGPGGSGPDES